MGKTEKESFVFYETFYEQLEEFDNETKLKFYEAIIAYGLYGRQPEGLSVLEKALWKTFEFAIDKAKARRMQNIENGKKGGRPALESKKYEVEYKVTEVVPLEMVDANTEVKTQAEVLSPIEIIEKAKRNKPKITEKNQKKPNYNLNVNVNDNVNENLNGNEKDNVYVYYGSVEHQRPYERNTQKSISTQKDKNIYQKHNSNNTNCLFKKPSVQEIKNYCSYRKNNIDSSVFYDFYESVGWMIGNRKMCDWQATVRIWEYRNKQRQSQFYNKPTEKKEQEPYKPDYSDEALEKFYGCSIEEHNRRIEEKGKRFELGNRHYV